MESDFTSLYASLGIDPDCDVDTLKGLFRRRIAARQREIAALQSGNLIGRRRRAGRH